jgi:hypothetical protein
VSIERVYICDGPGCRTNMQTASAHPSLWLTVTDGTEGPAMHFCSWDCILKYAAEIPPVEVVLLAEPY